MQKIGNQYFYSRTRRRKHLPAANNVDARRFVAEQATMDVVDRTALSGSVIALCALLVWESVGANHMLKLLPIQRILRCSYGCVCACSS